MQDIVQQNIPQMEQERIWELVVSWFKKNTRRDIGVQDLTFFNCEWFSCGSRFDQTYTQDIIHIGGNKARNRLLKTSPTNNCSGSLILSYAKRIQGQTLIIFN